MALLAPTGLVVTTATATGVFYGELRVAWNAVTGAVLYNIYRRETLVGGTYIFLGTATVLAVRSINLEANTSYDFVVAAEDLDGLQGALSASASATTIGPGDTPPRAPIGVQVTPALMRNSLTWFTGAADVFSWHVKRSTVSGGPYTQIPGGEVGEPHVIDLDPLLVGGVPHYYVVTADNGNPAQSANSAEVAGTPIAPDPGPGPGPDPGGGETVSSGVYMRRRRR
jgi:hypothetical protein